MKLIKAHAYGNDFLMVAAEDAGGRDPVALATAICDRHAGVGADGLIFYRRTSAGAAMRLVNADGSHAEVSGNGVRCLGAVLLAGMGIGPTTDVQHVEAVTIETDAGPKRLSLLHVDGNTYLFRASMGQPLDLREMELDAAGERLRVVSLRVGNPQCVLLGSPVTEDRLHRLGPALERHPLFPKGTNVEFAEVIAPDRIRILIWERGVGPTQASGTGACAAAVVGASFGGARRDVEVESPGGTQRVEWLADGLYLTGKAEIVFHGEWIG